MHLMIERTNCGYTDCEYCIRPAFPCAYAVAIANTISIFALYYYTIETLWIHSEFDKQNKIKQAYFKMFQGLQLKDESYMSR